MTVPDFIGIGVQKAGSTWLDRNLAAHPEVWMPPRKELHYFNRPLDARDNPKKRTRTQISDDHGKLSISAFREKLWLRRFRRTPRSDAWYISLFTPEKGQVSGEITPDYSTLGREDVARVRDLAPEARIMITMRNPVERTWSNALMEFKREGRDAEVCTVEELHQFAERDYVRRRSDYLTTLETWSEFFPPHRIFAGFMDDIEENPRRFLRSVYGFLGVDPSFRPPSPKKRVNVRSTGSMPTRVAHAFARTYREDLSRLEVELGGHTSFWLHCADNLIAGETSDERVPVPMGTSRLRDEWSGVPEFMSGPLSGFPAFSDRGAG